ASVPAPLSATSRGESISGRDRGVTAHLGEATEVPRRVVRQAREILRTRFPEPTRAHENALVDLLPLVGFVTPHPRAAPALLVEDVLELREECGIERERLGHHLVELFGGGRIQGELGLLRFGQERRVFQRLLKGHPQGQDSILLLPLGQLTTTHY